MKNGCLRTILLSFIVVSVILFQALSVSAALITDVRFWSAPDHTRVVLDLTEPLQYESSTSEKPYECHVELTGANLLTHTYQGLASPNRAKIK